MHAVCDTELGTCCLTLRKNSHCLISLNSAEVFTFENVVTVLPALKKFQSSTRTLYFQVSMDSSCLQLTLLRALWHDRLFFSKQEQIEMCLEISLFHTNLLLLCNSWSSLYKHCKTLEIRCPRVTTVSQYHTVC